MKERFDLRYMNGPPSRFGFRFTVAKPCRSAFLLWLMLVVSSLVLAQSKNEIQPVITTDDRAPVQVRYPKSDHLRDLQTDRDYQYGRDAPPPDNPVERLFAWLYRKFVHFLASKSYQNVWQYVILVAIAALVIYLLMKAEVLGALFPKKAQAGELDYENLAENIHEIDFGAAIDEAVRERNFRLAVRLLYLQTLKGLTDAGLIEYKPEKTNRQYVYELVSPPQQADFESLTRQFEFVWYGNFPIDEARFATVQDQFRQFDRASRLQTTTRPATRP